MKILLVHPGPDYSVADIHTGLLRALRKLGCQVESFNLNDRLAFYAGAGRIVDGEFAPLVTFEGASVLASKGIETVCFEWWPDVVVIVSCFFIPPETLDIIRARGIKVVIVHTESPYEDDRQLARAAHADLNFVNDPVNLERFAAIGPALYLPHCYDPDIHHPGPSDTHHDFVFVGTAYPSRVAFFEQVDWSGVDVAFGGNWDHIPDSPLLRFVAHERAYCLDNADTADLYRGAKVSANLYRREGDSAEDAAGWALGPREVELAACGTFFLREPRGEGDIVFPMLPTFDGPADFADQMRWWLDHPRQRARAATQTMAAITNRTFDDNARGLLGVLDQLKGPNNGTKSWEWQQAFC